MGWFIFGYGVVGIATVFWEVWDTAKYDERAIPHLALFLPFLVLVALLWPLFLALLLVAKTVDFIRQ